MKTTSTCALPICGEGGPSLAIVGGASFRGIAPSVTRFARATSPMNGGDEIARSVPVC